MTEATKRARPQLAAARQEVRQCIAEAVKFRLSSRLKPTTREVWLKLIGDFHELGLRAISERTFYRHVAQELARRQKSGRDWPREDA
ncbi:hypothetical protein ACU8MT_01335 [Rhizobium leguminosarum]